MFAREGYPFILGAAAIAAIAFALALRFRSWPVWLVALLLTIVALCVAWVFRNPTRIGERDAHVAKVTTNSCIVQPEAKRPTPVRQRTIAGAIVLADLSTT